jgi:hypothetical protein
MTRRALTLLLAGLLALGLTACPEADVEDPGDALENGAGEELEDDGTGEELEDGTGEEDGGT